MKRSFLPCEGLWRQLLSLKSCWRSAVLAFGLMAVLTPISAAYSVLTHEEIVDLAWKDRIQPLLKARFPAATDDDLKQAYAFAYGGSLVQDMGYYPFGSKAILRTMCAAAILLSI
jgi:hypothetical protein